MKQLTPRDKRADKVLPDQTAKTGDNRFVDVDTILFFAGRLAEADATRRAAARAYALVRKQFKTTGVSLGVFDLVEGMAQLDDENAIEDFLAEFSHIAKALSLPVGTQINLFEGAGNPLDAKQVARRKGYNLGVMGKAVDDQAYPANTDLGQEHLAGWYEGQEVLRDRFVAMNQQAADEAKAKEAAAAEKAKRAEEKAAKAAEKAGRKVPVTEEGDTVQ